MNIQRQIRLIIFAISLMLLPICADQGMTDCLAVIVGKSNGETTFGFWYKKHQEFTGVEEHLKKFAAISKNIRVTFIVHDGVTVKELVELIYRVHAIGFTRITIETCSDGGPHIEDWVFRKVQVLPVVDSKTTEPWPSENRK